MYVIYVRTCIRYWFQNVMSRSYTHIMEVWSWIALSVRVMVLRWKLCSFYCYFFRRWIMISILHGGKNVKFAQHNRIRKAEISLDVYNLWICAITTHDIQRGDVLLNTWSYQEQHETETTVCTLTQILKFTPARKRSPRTWSRTDHLWNWNATTQTKHEVRKKFITKVFNKLCFQETVSLKYVIISRRIKYDGFVTQEKDWHYYGSPDNTSRIRITRTDIQDNLVIKCLTKINKSFNRWRLMVDGNLPWPRNGYRTLVSQTTVYTHNHLDNEA